MSLTTLSPNTITVPQIRFNKCFVQGYQRLFRDNSAYSFYHTNIAFELFRYIINMFIPRQTHSSTTLPRDFV